MIDILGFIEAVTCNYSIAVLAIIFMLGVKCGICILLWGLHSIDWSTNSED